MEMQAIRVSIYVDERLFSFRLLMACASSVLNCFQEYQQLESSGMKLADFGGQDPSFTGCNCFIPTPVIKLLTVIC